MLSLLDNTRYDINSTVGEEGLDEKIDVYADIMSHREREIT